MHRFVRFLYRTTSEDYFKYGYIYITLSCHSDVGDWSSMGIVTDISESSNDLITCNSSHLTAFAVLVDLGGTLSGCHESNEYKALNIVSYVGCGMSLVCLLLTIIYLLSLKWVSILHELIWLTRAAACLECRKKLVKQIHYFVHLNLATALFLGLFMFFFVEVAGRSPVS